MRTVGNRQTAASVIFIIGLLLMFLGSAFLIGSLKEISQISIFASFFFVIVGAGCAVLAIKLNKRSLYLFLAALFCQIGLFSFLATLHIIPMNLARAWPLISVFSGLALCPAGWHRFGAVKAIYAVPALAFVLLGSVLLVFSFDLVTFSLAQFVKNWWPLLVVLAGLMLVLVSLSTKKSGGTER